MAISTKPGGSSSGVSWETARKGRMIRHYQFQVAMNAGLSSSSSAVSVNASIAQLFTGASNATPQSRGREMGEKNGITLGGDIFNGIDGLNYYSRKHWLDVHMGIGQANITNEGGAIYAGLFMHAPNVPVWSSTPGTPYAMLLYVRRLTSGINVESFELWSADGIGGSVKVTTLSGVNGPKSPISMGGQKTQRIGLVLDPGVSLSAYVDGVLGAQHTTNLPSTSYIPNSTAILSGVGVWLENSQTSDSARAEFSSLWLETEKP